MKRKFQEKGVTIVGISQNIKSPMNVGVTKYGGNKGEAFRPHLGLEIAENRANIQPFTVLPDGKIKTFEIACSIIVSHLNLQKQTSLKNLKKNK